MDSGSSVSTPVTGRTFVAAPASSDDDIQTAARRALGRVPPLWPLDRFVAVNPFVGLTDFDFASAAQVVGRATGARITMDRGFYAEAVASERIERRDLQAAFDEAEDRRGLPSNVDDLIERLMDAPEDGPPDPTKTVACVATVMTGYDWHDLVVDRISSWAAAYFDQGQALWPSPWRNMSPYSAWREEAKHDRTPELCGLTGFRAQVALLPTDPTSMVLEAFRRLNIPAAGREHYAHRLLMTVAGWSGYARFLGWERELRGERDDTLWGVLAIRLAWEVLLYECLRGEGITSGWASVRGAWPSDRDPDRPTDSLATSLVLQTAYEKAWRRRLFAQMPGRQRTSAPQRPTLQAAFCIDVRSEVYRRALETLDDRIETIGFAGFFGFPIEHVSVGQSGGPAQCPVLLTPKFTVTDVAQDGTGEATARIDDRRQSRLTLRQVMKSFKTGQLSGFGFVETIGLTYLAKLVTDAFGFTRPVAHPDTAGLTAGEHAHLGPSIEPSAKAERTFGLTAEQRLDTATGVLKAMSLTQEHGRLVLLVGHGSTTVNNPHATGLDCGACGGHSGEANARVAAKVLNDPDVRAGLAERGLIVADDTVFVAALHDTTTDEVRLFDVDNVPASHTADLAQAEQWLRRASVLARAERAHKLHIASGTSVDRAIMGRSRDWAETRPEWGLAGCAAFVAAPRGRTEGLGLDGRVFLHSYEWTRDEEFSVLELIMTAPMVVPSWINLQYYASSVDNDAYGSGNKVLHNVVGALGVLEGNGGDLRVGLPRQSVHDGETLAHEPMRLAVVIEAPTEAMNMVLKKHPSVRNLVDHGWLHLFAMDAEGNVAQQYDGNLRWRPVDGRPVEVQVANVA